MKKILIYIESIRREYLIIANRTVFLMIIFTIFYPYINLDTKKIYASNDLLVKKSAQTLAQNCSSMGDKEDCYKFGFEKLIHSYNFSLVEQTLYALQDLDEGVKSCHILSHHLSRTAVKKSPLDWKYLLDNVNVNTCGSGFLHGVLEAHLGDNPETEFSGKLSNEVCDTGADGYRKRMCTHFMGHFFVVNTFDDVKKAVPYCKDVVPELRFDCLDGVFMEHNQKIALEDHGLAELPEYTPEYAKKLEKICVTYNGVEGSACWTEMAEVYAKTFGYDAETIYKKCYGTSRDPRDGRSCYFKGIVLLATYPYNVTKEKLANICSFYIGEKDYQSCISSAISSLLHYSPKFTNRGIEMCSGIERDNEWCFAELGRQLKRFIPDLEGRQNLCQIEDEKYKKLCVNN